VVAIIPGTRDQYPLSMLNLRESRVSKYFQFQLEKIICRNATGVVELDCMIQGRGGYGVPLTASESQAGQVRVVQLEDSGSQQ
jgi:hypothetical protein